MEWPNHYACEKLLVLLTHYDMIERKLGRRNSNQLQPIRIVKTRIRNGVHCFEIEWEKPEHYATEDKHGELSLQTMEEESLFEAAYPEIVAIYKKEKLENKGKKQKSKKINPKENDMPESDDIMSFQSHMTLKPACEIFSKENSKLNVEIPDPRLPQKDNSESMKSLLLPIDDSCLDTQEVLLSSPSPLVVHQIKTVSKSLISESSHPNILSHNRSEIADLHLSTIDWEGTSFSNSPAILGNTVSHQAKSEPETTIANSFENIPGQLPRDSEWCTTGINKALDFDGNFQKASFEEHLLSGITDLHLQDLPLMERIRIKSSRTLDSVQPDVDLKTLSLCEIKEHCTANSSSACPAHFSKDLPGIHLQNESRNSKVLKGDQLFKKNYTMTTSAHQSVSNPVVKTSNVRLGPPKAALNHGRKVDVQTAQRTATKKTVCLDRHSSDEESAPVFEKVKYATQKAKQCSQKSNPFQFKRSDPQTHVKKKEQCAQASKVGGNEENCFPDPAQRSLNFLQRNKEKDDSGSCLDSPLPLCQRLKLRFQST
nr:flap endonuclease GEN homolog 1 isoform X2 [Dasypus novemcinctus]